MGGDEGSLPPQYRSIKRGGKIEKMSDQDHMTGGKSSLPPQYTSKSSSHGGMMGGADSLPDFDLSRFGSNRKASSSGMSSGEEPDDIKNLKVTKGAIFKAVAHHTLNAQEKGCYNSRYEDIKGDANTHFQTKGAAEGRVPTCSRTLSDYEALHYL